VSKSKEVEVEIFGPLEPECGEGSLWHSVSEVMKCISAKRVYLCQILHCMWTLGKDHTKASKQCKMHCTNFLSYLLNMSEKEKLLLSLQLVLFYKISSWYYVGVN